MKSMKLSELKSCFDKDLFCPEYPFLSWIFMQLNDDIGYSFIKIVVIDGKDCGKIIFSSVNDLIDHVSDSGKDYFFVEAIFKQNKVFRMMNIDKSKNEISFSRDPEKFQNGWGIFFNSMSNIVLHDPFFFKGIWI